jgi:hypothetical protein
VSSRHNAHLQLVLANAIDADQLGLEDQDAVGGNGTGASAAVRPLRLDGQLPLLARAHVEQTLVPALDDLAAADLEAEGLAAVVGGVELRAVGFEGTAVWALLV